MDIDTRERSTSLSSWFMELGSQSNSLFGMIGPSEDSPRKLPTETLAVFENTPDLISLNCCIGHHQLCQQVAFAKPAQVTRINDEEYISLLCGSDNSQNTFIDERNTHDTDITEDNVFYFVDVDAIKSCNWRTKQVETILATNGTVNSIAAYDHYVAVCGQDGRVIVLDLTTNTVVFEAVTSLNSQFNNSVNFVKFGEDTRVLVASNDQTIKMISLSKRAIVHTVNFPAPVNHMSVSPDGTKLLAVGDTNRLYLWDVDTRMDYISRIPTSLQVSDIATGFSFSCDWDSTSQHFAVLQERPGVVVVYNTDTLRAEACFYPVTRNRELRSVRFYEPRDSKLKLLIYSEVVLNIHIVDAVTYDRKQLIRLPASSPTPLISGFCVTRTLDSIIIATETGILRYRRTQPKSLRDLSLTFVKNHEHVLGRPAIISSLPADLLEEIFPDGYSEVSLSDGFIGSYEHSDSLDESDGSFTDYFQLPSLPSLPVPSLPSVPIAITVPSLPSLSISPPSLSAMSLPSLPSLPVPSMPSMSMPSMPSMSMPSMPSIPSMTMPSMSMPSMSIPSMPSMSMPSMPSMPSVTMPSMPSMPSMSMPSMPSMPSMSMPSMPSMPSMTMPSMPSVTMPSMPSMTMPSMPSMPSMSMPSMTIPSIKSLPVPSMPSISVPVPKMPSLAESIPSLSLPSIPSLSVQMPSIPSMPSLSLPSIPYPVPLVYDIDPSNWYEEMEEEVDTEE